jgi:hypothetical protein
VVTDGGNLAGNQLGYHLLGYHPQHENSMTLSFPDTVERWPLDRLIPHARNARTHSEDQVAQIAGSVAEFGFVNPILVGDDGVIVAEHGRVLAARKLGLADVPVIVLAHVMPIQRRALMIADNRIAENAGWNDEMLGAELAALREEDIYLGLLGFDETDIDRLPAGTVEDPKMWTKRRNRRPIPSAVLAISGSTASIVRCAVMRPCSQMSSKSWTGSLPICASPTRLITSLTATQTIGTSNGALIGRS